MVSTNDQPVVEQNHISPEERFRELVLIREKEKQIDEMRQKAKAAAAERIEAVQKEIEALREQLEAEVEREVEKLRTDAVKGAGQEAALLISKAEAEAQATSSKAGQRVEDLVQKLMEELLAK